MIFALAILMAALSSSDAVATLLNSRSSVSVARYNSALELVKKEAKEGKPLQQFVIAVTTDDKSLASKYLAASREKIKFVAEKRDNPLAWYLLSLERNDYKCLQKAAQGGNVQALNALGTIATQEAFNRNVSSNALEKILARSYDCFKKAAAKKDPNGYINLGTCYLRGFGCDIDLAMAFECFKAAANAGHPEGMDNLSACYELGHGVAKSAELSLYWRMRAKAFRGDKAAAAWLKDRR